MPDVVSAVFEGAISVRAVLDAGSRPLHSIAVADAAAARHARLIRLARRRGVPVRIRPRPELDAVASGRTHGGVIAEVGPRRSTSAAALTAHPSPFLALLDGVEDPYQLGQAVRALYAAGAHGLVLTRRTTGAGDAIVARASAGASERLPMVFVDDVSSAVRLVRRRGVRVVGARQRDAQRADRVDLTEPLLLVVGGRCRGVGSAGAAQADTWVCVSYGRCFRYALDAAGATAVLAFEVARQRHARNAQHTDPNC